MGSLGKSNPAPYFTDVHRVELTDSEHHLLARCKAGGSRSEGGPGCCWVPSGND